MDVLMWIMFGALIGALLAGMVAIGCVAAKRDEEMREEHRDGE